jgi:predicted signal transduction protein with EAL and GGDEF domain
MTGPAKSASDPAPAPAAASQAVTRRSACAPDRGEDALAPTAPALARKASPAPALLAVALVVIAMTALWGLVVLAQLLTLRDLLQAELGRRNGAAAAVLAEQASRPDLNLLDLPALIESRFALGDLRRLAVQVPSGVELSAFDGERPPQAAPAWFLAALPLQPEPGRAPVGGEGAVQGWLALETDTAATEDLLWAASVRAAVGTAIGLVALAALLGGLTLAWRQRRRRPLAVVMAQAEALAQGRWVTAPEPAAGELQPLARHLNTLVLALHKRFAQQAGELSRLQRQAQADAVTGLPRREHFIGRLDESLARSEGPDAALLVLRLHGLAAANQALGHEGADRLLGVLAEALQTYVERVPGSFAGRLNGSDFALCLPAAGVAADTSRSLLAALGASPLGRQGGLRCSIGAAEGLQGLGASGALAAADEALARADAALDEDADAGEADATSTAADPLAAQAAAGGRWVVLPRAERVADPAGSRAWRVQIAQALAEGRVQLEAALVRAPDGRALHLACGLRVQLQPEGPFHAARHWLALAARSRLLPEVDLAALDLALACSAADARERCVPVAAASLVSAGFADAVGTRLQRSPLAAGRLRLELGDGAVAALRGPLWEAVQGWRSLGARVGLLHLGGAPGALAALPPGRLDHVSVAARHLRGAASDSAVRDYARGLHSVLHGLGVQVFAAGVEDAADLATLWALGYDGVVTAEVEPPCDGAAALQPAISTRSP